MARRAILGVLAALAALLVATPASACTDRATLDLNGVRFAPGQQVTVKGRLFDTTADPRVVEVRNGSKQRIGELLALVPIDDDGNIEFTFTIPAVTTYETFMVSVWSYKGGALIDGLPREFTFFADPRLSAPAPQPTPTPTPAPAPAPIEIPAVPVAPPAPEQPAAPPVAEQPVVAPPVETRSQTSLPELAEELARALTVPPSIRVVAAEAEPRPQARGAASERRALPVTAPPVQRELVSAPARTLRPVAKAPAPVAVPAPVAASPSPGRSSTLLVAEPKPARDLTPWLFGGLLALGFLIFGAAAGGFVLARRWPPVEPTDPIEAELQELIAEHRLEHDRLETR